MKCPRCKAPTDVVRTENIHNGRRVQRTRQCFNGHRFTTLETVGDGLSEYRSAVEEKHNAIAEALRSGEKHEVVAVQFGVSHSTVERVARLFGIKSVWRGRGRNTGKKSKAEDNQAAG